MISTLSNVLASIFAVYANLYPQWTNSTPYAAGALVSNAGAAFVCYAAGTSDGGTGPSGVGSQVDANGVGWTPLLYLGERYLKQEGAPPRLIFVPSSEACQLGAPLTMSAGFAASARVGCTVYLWGAETSDDLTRYDAADAILHRLLNVIQRLTAGRNAKISFQRATDTNIATFGEGYQVRFSYEYSIPKDVAVFRAPETAPGSSIQNPIFPAATGSTGQTIVTGDVTVENKRP